jgi:hypothetical protein
MRTGMIRQDELERPMDKNIEILFEKISRSELAAKRGLQINEKIKPH